VWLGAAAFAGIAVVPAPAEAQTIQGCMNPAGQVRIIGDAESCKSQETLVTWNSAGPQGPQGPPGPPGNDAPGVIGDTDGGPVGGGFIELSQTTAALTSENVATGFPAYMVWANVAVEFNSGSAASGRLPSASSANCQIVYTVNGGATTYVADGRSVAFPIFVFANPTPATDRVVRLNIGLNGMIATNGVNPLTTTDSVDATLQCASNEGPTPNPDAYKVKALSFRLSAIGINGVFNPQ
jgi:hypothetical protein